jgi:hypothetical protein
MSSPPSHEGLGYRAPSCSPIYVLHAAASVPLRMLHIVPFLVVSLVLSGRHASRIILAPLTRRTNVRFVLAGGRTQKLKIADPIVLGHLRANVNGDSSGLSMCGFATYSWRARRVFTLSPGTSSLNQGTKITGYGPPESQTVTSTDACHLAYYLPNSCPLNYVLNHQADLCSTFHSLGTIKFVQPLEDSGYLLSSSFVLSTSLPRLVLAE